MVGGMLSAPLLSMLVIPAAFLLLRREAYAEVGGFDERYHMYCEDVDLCLRGTCGCRG